MVSLRTRIAYYTVFRFTATLDKEPQTAVNNSGALSGFELLRIYMVVEHTKG